MSTALYTFSAVLKATGADKNRILWCLLAITSLLTHLTCFKNVDVRGIHSPFSFFDRIPSITTSRVSISQNHIKNTTVQLICVLCFIHDEPIVPS